MLVKVRWKQSRRAASGARGRAAAAPPPPPLSQQEIEGGLAAILSPLAAILLAVSLWRLGQDLGVTGNFFIDEGPMAHWQPWFALAAGLALTSARLNRRSDRGGGDNPATG